MKETGGTGDVFSFDDLTSRQCTDIFNAYMRKNYILLALVSACRRGEMIGLRVDDIDLENNRIVIKRTGHYVTDHGIYFVDHLKNGSSSKSIDMPISVMGQLKAYI